MRRIMQARRRMLNQGWSKQLDAVQLCMRSPDCSFFSYLANSNSPASYWSFRSLSLQLAANSLSLLPRVSETEWEGVLPLCRIICQECSVMWHQGRPGTDVISKRLWGQQRLGHMQGGSSLQRPLLLCSLARRREERFISLESRCFLKCVCLLLPLLMRSRQKVFLFLDTVNRSSRLGPVCRPKQDAFS